MTSELESALIPILKKAGIADRAGYIKEQTEKGNERGLWQLVKSYERDFKLTFETRNIEAVPAPQHRILARLLHEGYISYLISFNWDNLVERAYKKQFGARLNKINREGQSGVTPCIWKLHGDVDDPDYDWVFPYEPGRVFCNLLSDLDRLEHLPDFALIIGYGESEQTVKDTLVRWLEQHITNIIRVRPSLTPPSPTYFPENARSFFLRMERRFDNEIRIKSA